MNEEIKSRAAERGRRQRETQGFLRTGPFSNEHVDGRNLKLSLYRPDLLRNMTSTRTMMRMKVSVFLMFLWILTVSRGDSEVSCVYMETCILPCSFQGGPLNHIIWLKTNGFQDQFPMNRTSPFKDQISRGNASLQLTGVNVQDEGRYMCRIRDKESYVNLKVYAPVHEVNIRQVENRITCSSEGIYPEPELTWSTRPPSTMSLQNTSTVQQNEQQLYSISSSLVLSHSDPDLVYSCTVSTPTNRRRAAWRKLTPVNGSTPETNITCAASDFSFSDLVWRFNHRQIIVKQSRTDGSSTVSEEWRQQVKDVSESGDITLQDLSSDQEGIYTCEVSNAEETLISDTYVEISGGSSVSAGGIIGGVVGAVLVLTAAVGLFLFWKKKRGKRENSRRARISEGIKDSNKVIQYVEVAEIHLRRQESHEDISDTEQTSNAFDAKDSGVDTGVDTEGE